MGFTQMGPEFKKKKEKKRPPKIMTYFFSVTRVVLIAILNYFNYVGYNLKGL